MIQNSRVSFCDVSGLPTFLYSCCYKHDAVALVLECLLEVSWHALVIASMSFDFCYRQLLNGRHFVNRGRFRDDETNRLEKLINKLNEMVAGVEPVATSFYGFMFHNFRLRNIDFVLGDAQRAKLLKSFSNFILQQQMQLTHNEPCRNM